MASKYSATVRSLPENSAASRSGSGCPVSDSAASRSPAAHPSVRSYSNASAGSASSTAAPRNSLRASSNVNRRSSVRNSVSSPSSRSRCNPSRTSCRVARTNRSSCGPRITSNSSWRSASSESSSCTSSITSQTRSSSGARSLISRSAIAHPSMSGAAVSGRTSADPGSARLSAPSTASQNLCGSRSSRPTATDATRPLGAASAIHDRSKTVFPLPGGADTTVTRAGAPSRASSPGRDTTRPAPWPASGPATAPGSCADPTATIIARPVQPLTSRQHGTGWSQARQAGSDHIADVTPAHIAGRQPEAKPASRRRRVSSANGSAIRAAGYRAEESR